MSAREEFEVTDDKIVQLVNNDIKELEEQQSEVSHVKMLYATEVAKSTEEHEEASSILLQDKREQAITLPVIQFFRMHTQPGRNCHDKMMSCRNIQMSRKIQVCETRIRYSTTFSGECAIGHFSTTAVSSVVHS
ncbi:hypothetical protein AVEN_23643-1 [Araneus ventricosus]|uniref:Uncharacterized protein n=1 Tax=Araneus ventricosus TaxID=182803 RepID=A0A4Y2BK21_ARAVE|nr:hypothetical protein AVEN_23643-1 [Araneus ventricosus]